jgi:hypothetical protein
MKEFIYENKGFIRASQKSNIIKIVSSMICGEKLHVSFNEWQKTNGKNAPAIVIQSSCIYPGAFLNGRKYSSRIVKDGWIITRTK